MSATETQPRTVADGSAVADRHPVVVIDRSDFVDRHRYVCPNGHSRWDPTNAHIWCRSCRDQYEAGDDVDPEHYEL
ncbi:MAG: hypothetical protein ACOCUO_02065, partial [archaeon]